MIRSVRRRDTQQRRQSRRKENAVDREAYRQKMEAQIKEWKAKIDELETRAGKVTAEARDEYHRFMERLRAYQKELPGKLNEMKHASGEAWESLKSGMEKAAADLGDALKEARSKFMEKKD